MLWRHEQIGSVVCICSSSCNETCKFYSLWPLKLPTPMWCASVLPVQPYSVRNVYGVSVNKTLTSYWLTGRWHIPCPAHKMPLLQQQCVKTQWTFRLSYTLLTRPVCLQALHSVNIPNGAPLRNRSLCLPSLWYRHTTDLDAGTMRIRYLYEF